MSQTRAGVEKANEGNQMCPHLRRGEAPPSNCNDKSAVMLRSLRFLRTLPLSTDWHERGAPSVNCFGGADPPKGG